MLRHDCQSSGCGDAGCGLCQFNPSRVCTRNLKQKYLIDDALRAKCGAPLRVELVDAAGRRRRLENGGSGGGGGGGGGSVLPRGARLEACVLNGERYRELCPDGVGGGAAGPLPAAALASCILAPQNPKKPLLKREPAAGGGVGGGAGASNSAGGGGGGGGGFTADGRAILELGPDGAAPLSDLAVAASSEALLAGKAPTFRLLVWAVADAHSDSDNGSGSGGGSSGSGGGNGGCSSAPLPGVAYVVSEAFVVATKRVKHAVKSDIPCVADHVSKLVHIGKATVAKLTCGDLKRVSSGTPAPGTGDTTTLFPFCRPAGPSRRATPSAAHFSSPFSDNVPLNPTLHPPPPPKQNNPWQAAREEGVDLSALPDALRVVESVGDFQRLLAAAEASSELRHKVRRCVCVCVLSRSFGRMAPPVTPLRRRQLHHSLSLTNTHTLSLL